MGYGCRALELLQQYYEGKVPSLSEIDNQPQQEAHVVDSESVDLLTEKIAPRKKLPPLLLKLSEREPERLDYLGVSYGLTSDLLRFWKKSGFVPVYLRQTSNELTGEHSCIMLKKLNDEDEEEQVQTAEDNWLQAYFKDFRKRFLSLLSYQFRTFTPALSLNMLQQKRFKDAKKGITRKELESHFTKYDLKRLELYSQNMVDYHLIMDMLPDIARLYFLKKIDAQLNTVQCAILLGIGLQHKTVDELEKQLDLPVSQILGLFTRIIKKIVQYFNMVLEKEIEQEMVERKEITMEPVKQTLDEEMNEAAKDVAGKMKESSKAFLDNMDLRQYAIKGSEQDWDSELSKGKKAVSIKSIMEKKRKTADSNEEFTGGKSHKKHKKKQGKHKH